MDRIHGNRFSEILPFTDKHLKQLFQPSFWPNFNDVIEYETISSEGRIYLSEACVSPQEFLFPKEVLHKFLNINDIDGNIIDVFSYRSKIGDFRVIDSIILFQKSRYGQNLNRSNILQTIGATNAIDLAISVIMKQGDSILLPTPSYFVFWKSAVSRGFNYNIYYSGEEELFKPTLEGIKRNIKSNTRIVGLIQPLFPCGYRIEEGELIKIIDFLSKKRIYIILDLVYDFLTYDNKSVICTDSNLGACFDRNLKYLVQINSFSKTWSAPGIRFGFLIASEEIIRKGSTKLVSTLGRCPTILAPLYKMLVDGTTQMINDSSSEFGKILKYNTLEYQNRAKELSNLIIGSGLEIFISDAGFNLFVKLTNVPNNYINQWKFLEKLYNHSSVIIDFGSFFGVPHHPMIPTYIRVNLGLPKEKLLEGMKTLSDFHKNYVIE